MNALLSRLRFEPALEALGDDYYDIVTAADFPKHQLRFRNDAVLACLGIDPREVQETDWLETFGRFQGRTPFLALRYHGYQFGEYNPGLGDGRGFLYGQVRGRDGQLYDLGTKGSGPTPYSRGGDGRLTLKGGVREVLAAEALHGLGVNTSRCLSVVETGEALWRGDEPSPTRSSVMVRCSQSHLRFGTFERLDYLGRRDLIQTLLDHVIKIYYPPLLAISDPQTRYQQFYAELVQRVATLAAQWMSVGFCHAVLNTDNMSITGESFDYGPYAFISEYDPKFTAAYFDYGGLYSYGNQPGICRWNLRMLQRPLRHLIPESELETCLETYAEQYHRAYRQRMLAKLGFVSLPLDLADELLRLTLQLLANTQVSYHDFFLGLTKQFSRTWYEQPASILQTTLEQSDPDAVVYLEKWRHHYYLCLNTLSLPEIDPVAQCLRQHNPVTVLLRPEIEAVWEAITVNDDWEPFSQLVKHLQDPFAQSNADL